MQYMNSSTNDTINAEKALWHFVQAWFQEFQAYKSNNDAISIFKEFYDERYESAFVAFFEKKNMCIVNGFINVTDDIFIVHLDTLSVVNDCVDLLTQELAYKNTYCIQVINQSLYQQVVDNFNRLDTDDDDLIINC